MRLRYALVALLALASFAVVGGKWLLYSQVTPPPIASPASLGFLVILGVGDKAATNWDGSIAVTGATILTLKPWRFSGADAISGTTSWKMSSRAAPAPPGIAANQLMQENGVIVKISDTSTPVTFNVQTTQGNFSFSSQDLTFGVSKSFLGGRALVM